MDKLVRYINAREATYGVRLQYSLLSEFLDSVRTQNVTWSTRGPQDFFPYIDTPKAYWTGFYTSRNALKGYARLAESALRTAEILHVLARNPWGPRAVDAPDLLRLQTLRTANGEATHHDAVSGTSVPQVVEMYLQHLMAGTDNARALTAEALGALLAGGKQAGPNLSFDVGKAMANVTASQSVAITVFNPLSWTLRRFVSVPAYRAAGYAVIEAATGKTVASDVLPALLSSRGPCQVPGTCGAATVEAPFELHFAVNVPPLGSAVYVVSLMPGDADADARPSRSDITSGPLFIANSQLRLDFDSTTGLLARVTNRRNNATIACVQNFYEYISVGSFHHKNVSAGAYILHPDGPATVVRERAESVQVVAGRYVAQVRQVFTKPCQPPDIESTCGLTQTFALYDTEWGGPLAAAAEMLISAGPLRLQANLVTRFVTSLTTNRTMYTDDNCFSMHKRTYAGNLSDPIGGNYFPVTCATFLRDIKADAQLTFLVDRTRGGGLGGVEGTAELMLHRRVISSDRRGPLELDDTDHLQHLQTLLLYDTAKTSTRLRKLLQYQQQFPPTLMASTVPGRTWPYRAVYAPLRADLPDNVHLLSLLHLNLSMARMVVRLAHIYQAGDDTDLAQSVTLNLNDYFAFSRVEALDERSLTTVLPVSEVDRRWTWQAGGTRPRAAPPQARSDDATVTLTPAQIRTFYATLA